MNPHHSLGVGGGIGAGVGGGVGLGLGVGVGGWMLVRRSYKRKTNITTPKYLPDAEYIILYRVYRMYPDRGTTRGRQTTAQREGGGRQSTRVDRYCRASAAELLLLWDNAMPKARHCCGAGGGLQTIQ